MDQVKTIMEVIMFAFVAYMTWRGLETYGRRMEEYEDEPEAAAKAELAQNPDNELQILQDLDARMQTAFNEAIRQGKHLPNQFYYIDTARGPIVWIYNPPYAKQHFIEMHPYTEC